jgi:glycerol-3-phosphate acyltransferase PlsY
VIGYLLGSISTGVLLASRKGHDIRSEGSHNTGASNALRVVGLKTGLMTFVGDCAKAALSVLLGLWIAGRAGGMMAGLTVIIGHNWPLFFQFKGGKGVACSCAVLVILFPVPGMISIALCALVIALTRYISLGSLTMLVAFTLIMAFTQGIWPCGAWSAVIAAIGILRHRSNIERLLKGQENKISFRKKG